MIKYSKSKIILIILIIIFQLTSSDIPTLTCDSQYDIKYKFSNYQPLFNADSANKRFNRYNGFGYLYEKTKFSFNQNFSIKGKLFTSNDLNFNDGFAVLLSKSIQTNKASFGGFLGYHDLSQMVVFEMDMYQNIIQYNFNDKSATTMSIHDCIYANTKCSVIQTKEMPEVSLDDKLMTHMNITFEIKYESLTKNFEYTINNLDNNWNINFYTLNKTLTDFNTEFEDGFFIGISTGFIRTSYIQIEDIYFCSSCFSDQININGQCVCKEKGKILNPSSLKCEYCPTGKYSEDNKCVSICKDGNLIDNENKLCAPCNYLKDGSFCVKSCINSNKVVIDRVCQDNVYKLTQKQQDKIQGKIYLSELNCGVTKREISLKSAKFSKETFTKGDIIDILISGIFEISTIINHLKVSIDNQPDKKFDNNDNSGSFSVNSLKEFNFKVDTSFIAPNSIYSINAKHYNSNMMISSCIRLIISTQINDLQLNSKEIYNFSCPIGTLPSKITYLQELPSTKLTILTSNQIFSKRVYINPHNFLLEDDIIFMTNLNVISKLNPFALSAIDQLAFSFINSNLVSQEENNFQGVKILFKLNNSEKLSLENIFFNQCYGEACYASFNSGVNNNNVRIYDYLY